MMRAMETALQLVDMTRLTADLDRATGDYRAAQPFPHIVLDDVLHRPAFEAAVAGFPEIRDEFWKAYVHVNETKFSNTQPDTWSDSLQAVAQEFCSPEFVTYLERLTGIDNLIPDYTMDGGGLHQTLRDGHLNIHADFTTHHTHDTWARRVNILLYLNEEWLDRMGRQARALGQGHDRMSGHGDTSRQPDAGVHDQRRLLPRPPGRPHLPA